VGVKEGGGMELWAERGWAHGGCLMERREGRERAPCTGGFGSIGSITSRGF